MLGVGVVKSTSVTNNTNKSTYAHKLIASYEVAGWLTKEMELTGLGRKRMPLNSERVYSVSPMPHVQ